MKSASTGTLQVSTLTLRTEHPQTGRIVTDPTAAHSSIARCAPSGFNEAGQTLFRIGVADERGRPNLIVQTPAPVDWSPLIRDRIVVSESARQVDLSVYEEGVQVKLEGLVAPSKRRKNDVWEKTKITDPRSLARSSMRLGLDADQIDELSRDGLVWTWRLKNGAVGTRSERAGSWEEPIASEDECRRWLMESAFAVLGVDGVKTGETSVEFMSCRVGTKRIVGIERVKNGKTSAIKPVARWVEAVAIVTNHEKFVERLARGVGRLKLYGFGLIQAEPI